MHFNAKNITGKRFGKLTATKPVGSKNGSVLWECLCDCGNTKTARAVCLMQGETKSCGCLRDKPAYNFIDMTGQKFGTLTVISKAEMRGLIHELIICAEAKSISVNEVIKMIQKIAR